MKLIHTLTALSTLTVLNLTAMTQAGEKCCKSKTDATKTVNKGDCKDCDDCESCDKSADANTVNLVVTGMTCEACSDKVTKALTGVEGVTAKKVCHKSGNVAFAYDPAKTDKAAAVEAISKTGFKVAGEKVSIPVTGMTCSSCSTKVKTALEAIDGCTVASVCHKSGHAEVTIDTAKTSTEKVKEAIKKTGFKTPATESAPAEKTES